jgi:hypothetical protein
MNRCRGIRLIVLLSLAGWIVPRASAGPMAVESVEMTADGEQIDVKGGILALQVFDDAAPALNGLVGALALRTMNGGGLGNA